MAEADPFAEPGARPHQPPGRWKDARGRWRRVPLPLRVVVYILAALFTLWLILFVTKGRFLKRPFESIMSRSLEREVRVGGDFNLYLNPISVQFLAEKLTVGNVPWASKPHLFAADRIAARVSTLPLILGRREVQSLDLVGGDGDFEWSRDGRHNTWTIGDPDKPGKPFEMPGIARATIAGTTLRYRDPRLQIATDVIVDTVRARDTRFQNEIRFHGTGTMRQRPFRLAGALLSPNETLATGRNPLTLTAIAGPTRMDVSGTLPGPTRLEGADLALRVRGANLARLFDILGVAIPPTRAYHLRSALTYEDGAWQFRRMTGMFGGSDLSGRMTISLPKDRLLIDAALATDTLDMVDVGPFIGYDPETLANRGVQAAVSQPGGTPRVLPDATLRIDAIRRFDARVRYTVRRVRQKAFPISNIGLTLGLDHALLSLSPLTFDMAGGFLSSDVIINARKAPVHTDYDIRLSPTPMGKLLARWGVEESGTSGTIKARVTLAGDGDTVRKSLATSNGRIAIILPAGKMWARNIQLSELDIGLFVQKMFQGKLKQPVDINCGLIGFTVRDGIAAADPVLIDTRKNVILGRGGFSFRNESLDMAVRADGKKFSLFSGQSPIGVGGAFARPAVSPISPELASRAGVGLGLGVALTPLGAVLAFVDVGDAKSAACGPVLAGAKARAQRTTRGQPRDDVGRGTTAKAESGRTSRDERKKQAKTFLGIF
jgi:hypothetical protein